MLPVAPARASRPARVPSDFNGDGYPDLAIGIPLESARGAPFEGAVSVLYGGTDGVTAEGDQLWRPSSPGLEWGHEAIAYSRFGDEVEAGNFDGDRFADLAIGSPDWEQVNVLYGSDDGLTTRRDQRWEPSVPGLVQMDPPFNFRFGDEMESGDFDGDGSDDLVLRISDTADTNGESHVRVLYGSEAGLTVAGNQIWAESTPGVKGRPPAGGVESEFGWSLAAGDFGGGPQEDLAISEPQDRRGFVHVLYGSGSGLTAAADQLWSRERVGMPGTGTRRDMFGASLAAADFGGAGRLDDLAIGVPGARDHSGAVVVLYAAPGSLSSDRRQVWTQDTFGIDGEAEPDDVFGGRLVAGDLDGDGFADLASSVADRSKIGGYGGAVSVIYGMDSCEQRYITVLCAVGDQRWTPDALEVPFVGGDGVSFSSSLSIREDVDHGDLVIGMPGMTVGGFTDAGGVGVVYGEEGRGLTPAGSQIWTADTPGVLGRAQQDEWFGAWLVSQ